MSQEIHERFNEKLDEKINEESETKQFISKLINCQKFTLTNQSFHSLPIRMPGQLLQISCSEPNFHVTLRGGGDDEGLFEKNQKPNKWTINGIHYGLGRIAYDIVFDKNLKENDGEVLLSAKFSTIIQSELRIFNWNFQLEPKNWVQLPVSTIQPISSIKLSTDFPYRVAVAGSPIQLFSVKSNKGIFKFSQVPEKERKNICLEKNNKITLDFSRIFHAWLVFDQNPFQTVDVLELEYF